MRTRDYRNIKAFVKADDLVTAVYTATHRWPKEEQYGLTSQIRRAAVSVAANIVEGSARLGDVEFLQFLRVANGSLRETGYLAHLAYRLKYLDEAQYDSLHRMYEEACRVLWGLMESIATTLKNNRATSKVMEGHADYTLIDPGSDIHSD